MSISTYAQLTTAVTNWLHRSDLSGYAADFITLGESRIYNRLRVPAMENALSSTVSGGAIAVPTGYIDLKFAYVNSSPVQSLERKTAEWIYSNYPYRSATGKPKFIARDGDNFIFGPYPDSTYTISGRYYAALSALSSATNSIFLAYPGLYLFAALAESAPFLKADNRVAMWEAKFEQLLKMAQDEADREAFSGSVLAVTPG